VRITIEEERLVSCTADHRLSKTITTQAWEDIRDTTSFTISMSLMPETEKMLIHE
jgi:hypothetical protein